MRKHFDIIRIFLGILILLIVIGVALWRNGVFVMDHSAKYGLEALVWKGRTYTSISGEYTEGRTIAKTEDGKWNINEVKEDPTHKFVVVRSFLDDYLYVAEDYLVPTSGNITTVSWGGNYISEEVFLNAISKIVKDATTSFEYETEAIFALNENQRMKRIYVAYEDCPVATEYLGYLGKINGNWVITTYISEDQHNEDGSPKKHSVGCYLIPETYHDVLQRYYTT